MSTDNTIKLLRQFKEDHAQEYGILELGVFGSVGRGDARPDSDVDICVRTETPNPFVLVHLKEAIETLLNKPVDIVRLRETMNPFLKKRIEQEAQYV